MSKREVYPNPPLRLVAAELRFPTTRRTATAEVWDALEDALGSELPEVETKASLDREQRPRPARFTTVLIRTSEAKDRALTLSFGALRIEFSRYEHYGELRSFVERALDALSDIPQVGRATRLGLRYVNEISTPNGLNPTDLNGWSQYVRSELIPALSGLPTSMSQAWFSSWVALKSTDGGRDETSLMYGLLPYGGVEDDGPLRLRTVDEPCFLLDIDTYQRSSVREAMESGSYGLLSSLDRLHDSVESVFNYCITERLKNEVFRRPPTEPKDGDRPMLLRAGNE